MKVFFKRRNVRNTAFIAGATMYLATPVVLFSVVLAAIVLIMTTCPRFHSLVAFLQAAGLL